MFSPCEASLSSRHPYGVAWWDDAVEAAAVESGPVVNHLDLLVLKDVGAV